MSAVGRIQWSKLGVTVYDGEGGFVSRMEHPDDLKFFDWCILNALKEVSSQQQKRRAFKGDEVTGAPT
jgi:hypothetical protein